MSARCDSAENILASDCAILNVAAKLILSMEIEGNVFLVEKVQDDVFERSISARVAHIKSWKDAVEGSMASNVMNDIIAQWGCAGSAIDDYLSGESSAESVRGFISKLEDGYHDEDYDKFGWDNE